MASLLRAIALIAVLPALACALWEPEPIAEPKLEFPEPEIDVPLFEIDVGSALWLARSPIGSFYLFGSTDPTREGGYAKFGPDVQAAYAESQEVVHEIDLGAAEPAQTIALMKRYGTLKRPATLQSRVSRETWALLEERFTEVGFSADVVRSMQPWLVSFALANHTPLPGGSDPLPAIADRVRERALLARTTAKPVVGLRTLESQFQMFAALPRGVQDSLLRSAFETDAPGEFLWSHPMPGDSASASSERAQLYEHLVYRRNEQMAERLFQIGIDRKVRFVEVGILHLLGERGIPSLLAQRGFKVSRVQ